MIRTKQTSPPGAQLADALAGRPVTWEGGRGTADGIDEDGRLRVRLPGGGTAALDAGEVHLGVPV